MNPDSVPTRNPYWTVYSSRPDATYFLSFYIRFRLSEPKIILTNFYGYSFNFDYKFSCDCDSSRGSVLNNKREMPFQNAIILFICLSRVMKLPTQQYFFIKLQNSYFHACYHNIWEEKHSFPKRGIYIFFCFLRNRAMEPPTCQYTCLLNYRKSFFFLLSQYLLVKNLLSGTEYVQFSELSSAYILVLKMKFPCRICYDWANFCRKSEGSLNKS